METIAHVTNLVISTGEGGNVLGGFIAGYIVEGAMIFKNLWLYMLTLGNYSPADWTN